MQKFSPLLNPKRKSEVMTHRQSFRIYPWTWLSINLAIIALLTACGAGNGQGLEADGNLQSLEVVTVGGGGTGGDSNTGGGTVNLSGNPNATLAWVQSNVFGGVCSQCHTGAGAPLGVNWSSESDTCSNIGRVSGEVGPMLEVESGRPDLSYVVWKIEGAGPNGEPIVAAQMPLNNPALSPDAIQNIKDWIADGTPGCSV